MSELVAFVRARLDDDEAVARAAIDPHRPGVRWQWVRYDNDEPAPAPSVDDGQLSLRTVEEFPTADVGDLPAFIIGTAEVDEPRALPHIARHDPARVLAQVAAMRRILDHHKPMPLSPADAAKGYLPNCEGCWEDGGEDGAPTYPCFTARALASVWADHPDYREQWAS